MNFGVFHVAVTYFPHVVLFSYNFQSLLLFTVPDLNSCFKLICKGLFSENSIFESYLFLYTKSI